MKTSANFQHRLTAIQSNLLNYAYILTSNRDDAYSLLNATTAAVLDNRNRFTGRTSVKDWALAVMRTIYMKKFVGAVKEVEIVDYRPRLYHLTVTDEVTVAADACCIEESRFHQEVMMLDAHCATVYRLYLSGHTTEEIALSCDVDPDTVDHHIAAANRRLATLFA